MLRAVGSTDATVGGGKSRKSGRGAGNAKGPNGGGGGTTPEGFDTSKNTSFYTFSNSNKTALITVETTPDYRPCVGIQGRDSTGHWYFEMVQDSLPGGALLGVGTSVFSIVLLPGFDAVSWSYYSANGEIYTNGVSAGAYGNTWTQADVIGVRLDGGKLYFYKNGVIQNSGTAAFLAVTGTVYPIWSRGGVADNSQVTLTTRAPFAYSLPAGASAWG